MKTRIVLNREAHILVNLQEDVPLRNPVFELFPCAREHFVIYFPVPRCNPKERIPFCRDLEQGPLPVVLVNSFAVGGLDPKSLIFFRRGDSMQGTADPLAVFLGSQTDRAQCMLV